MSSVYEFDRKDVVEFLTSRADVAQQDLMQLEHQLLHAKARVEKAYELRNDVEALIKLGHAIPPGAISSLNAMRWPVRDKVEDLWDSSIRVDKVIWLAAQQDGSDMLEEFFEDRDKEEVEKIFNLKFECDPQDSVEETLSFLCRKKKTGFLVQASTPVPSEFHEGGFSFSWGVTRPQWFYTEAFDDAFAERLIIFHEQVVEEEERKSHAKKDPNAQNS